MEFENDRESMVWALAATGALASGSDAITTAKRADALLASFRKRDAARKAREDRRYDDHG